MMTFLVVAEGATSVGMAIGHVVVENNTTVVPSWCDVDDKIMMRTVARNNKKTVEKAVLEPSMSFFHDNTVASCVSNHQCSQWTQKHCHDAFLVKTSMW